MPDLIDFERQYRRRRPRRESNPRELWIGLAVGLVSSALFWYALISGRLGNGAPAVALFFWTAKVFAGLVLTASRGWNHIGKGILLSIGLVLLIGIGTCGTWFLR